MADRRGGTKGEPEGWEPPWSALSPQARDRLRPAEPLLAVEPMRATPEAGDRTEGGWLHEPHYEGRRCVVVREGPTLRFLEAGRDAMAGLEHVADVLRASPSNRFVVDGTIVRFDATNEQDAARRWRERVEKGGDQQPHYYVFDLLQLEGRDTTALRLVDRKTLLRAALRFEPPVHYVTHRTGVGEFVRRAARREGWSGVVAKRADSTYRGGASPDWQIWRGPRHGAFLVAGYLDQDRIRLVLAAPGAEGLAFAGLVELPETERETLEGLIALMRPDSPLVEAELPGAPAVRWLEPERVCGVEFADWSRCATVVSAVFVGWQRQPDAREGATRAPQR